MIEQSSSLLRKSKLSITDARKFILDRFLNAGGALSHADLEKDNSLVFDRVTIYRTLQTFVESGIIHQIPTTDNTVLYALCKDSCEAGHHHDEHVHFICDHCEKTICLDEVTVPMVKLPVGFTPRQSAMIVRGCCKECKN